MELTYQTIGTYYSASNEKYQLPIQSGLDKEEKGHISLNPNLDYNQVLADLNDFSHIWVIFHFHKSKGWKPKIDVPRSSKKKGVLSTRSPHRPNSIGLSCVKLLEIEKNKLWLEAPDLINETPILDIKPYLSYCDSVPNANNGWLEALEKPKEHKINFDTMAHEQLEWLKENNVNLFEYMNTTLSFYPYPNKKKRVKLNKSDNDIIHCELSCKTWRINYRLNTKDDTLVVQNIFSGYHEEYLNFDKISKWPDVPLHNLFNEKFNL
jgi:tRNA (adenine37-N6)-methyltransferase